MCPETPLLLAVDVGLKTGLACFREDGRLSWYRSHNYGSVPRLRRGLRGVLDAVTGCRWLYLEGGGVLADIWEREALRRGLTVRIVAAETWRDTLLYPRRRRDGKGAKHNAVILATRVIRWSGMSNPTALRHDAAEAILLGLWGLVEEGLLGTIPPEITR